MARPSNALAEFATTTNYPAGAFTWSATARREMTALSAWAANGITPDAQIEAQSLNAYMGVMSEWVTWLTREVSNTIDSTAVGGDNALVTALQAGFDARYAELATANAFTSTNTVVVNSATDALAVTNSGAGDALQGVVSNDAARAGRFSTSAANGAAIEAVTTGAASSSAAAVIVGPLGAGAGIAVTTVNGYGAVLDAPGSRAPLRLVPRSTPGTVAPGDIWVSSVTECLRYNTAAANMVVKAHDGSDYIDARGYSAGPDDTTSSSYSSICSATFSADVVGDVWIRVAGRHLISGSTTLLFQIYDSTAVAAVAAAYETVSGEGNFSLFVRYTLPATGSRNISLRFSSTNNTDNVRVFYGSIHVEGVF